jgi:hypothetical protein
MLHMYANMLKMDVRMSERMTMTNTPVAEAGSSS